MLQLLNKEKPVDAVLGTNNKAKWELCTASGIPHCVQDFRKTTFSDRISEYAV